MTVIRIFAILTLGLLGGYYVLRTLATQCGGLQCDIFIGPSLLLPLLILLVTAVTGVLALFAAGRRGRWAWLGLLALCALVGVLGPIISLVVLRDSPDRFVLVATSLILLVPLSALIYSFAAPSPQP